MSSESPKDSPPTRNTNSEHASSEEDDVSLHVDMNADAAPANNDDNSENLDLKNETRKTSVIRCLFILTLLTTAVIVANVALIMTLNEEEVDFKKEYTRLSERVVARFLGAFEEKIAAADSLVSQLSFSDASTVSIPAFERQAEGVRQLSTSTTISYSPLLIGQAEREAWENYASESFSVEARSQFQSKYVPHEGKYNGQSQPLVSYRGADVKRSVDQGIYRLQDGTVVSDDSSEVYAPIWQVAPFNNYTASTVMFNQLSEGLRRQAIQMLVTDGGYVISDIFFNPTMDSLHAEYAAPVFAIFYPIFSDDALQSEQQQLPEPVGIVTLEIGLESLFENVLPGYEDEPLTAVVDTSCGGQFTFQINGNQVSFVGAGDLHEDIPDVGEITTTSTTYQNFDELIAKNSALYPTTDTTLCSYMVTLYPTNDFYSYYITNRPLIIEGLVGVVFFVTVAVFVGYDCMIERRQRRVLAAAQRTNALVSSLFPQGVRARMYDRNGQGASRQLEAAPKLLLKSFMVNSNNTADLQPDRTTNTTEPIADLFPHATVLFADISGFSAWASEREPSQVFTLLETMFTSFDTIARRLGVFKVETVGDCYVAATGIPEARDDHAIAMVRFANAMLHRATDLAKALESTLGPGTGDLTMRVGIHSGPVTAGVLRGEKSRFQLFGDTMNSGSRMESTSMKGRIQLSADTADLVIKAGKGHWIEPREDLVEAKGKGKMQTYWLKPERQESGARVSMNASKSITSSLGGDTAMETSDEKERLIEWNLTVMASLIERIIARRDKRRQSRIESSVAMPFGASGMRIMDEVREVVPLARFDSQAVLRSDDYVTVPAAVRSELRDYIAQICSLYLDNPFHNFAHASHVAMSAHKLLRRITRPDEVNYSHARKEDVALELHEATYGISSDPLAQLAIVVSALVHDAGHTGVPNGQLAKEHPNFAVKYGKKSIAEQRSLDMSLELLEAPCYENLRACIVPTKEEQIRFRQLIINSVMATDIFDKDLGALRKIRWDKAFGGDTARANSPDDNDRKATIVIEHVIQASDVAHTMQHWKIYQKWNENLYREMFKAYTEGRSDRDPTEGWYKGELWFFDNYVIPLAKKLKDCGVFGTSSDEYLHYAMENRAEWERKGEAIVARMESSMKGIEIDEIKWHIEGVQDAMDSSSLHQPQESSTTDA